MMGLYRIYWLIRYHCIISKKETNNLTKYSQRLLLLSNIQAHFQTFKIRFYLQVAQTSFNTFRRPCYWRGWHYNTLSHKNNVMVPCETLIIVEQDAVVFMTYQVTMATGKPCTNTLYFGFSCSYLKNELGDPNFFGTKVISRPRWNCLQSFKKFSRADSELNFQFCEVALNSLHRIFF